MDSVCEGDELAVVFGFTIWWQDLDGHSFFLLQCCFFLAFHVMLGMIVVFVGVVAGRVLLWL